MKKLIAILLAFILVFGLAACGNDGNTSSDNVSSKDDASSVGTNTSTDDNTSSDDGNTSSDDNTSSEPTSSNTPIKETKNMQLLFDDFYDFKQDGAIAVKSSDTEKITVSGTEIRAVGVTSKPVTVTVTLNNNTAIAYNTTVKKAKLNIVVIAGQSNAMGHTGGVPADALKYNSTTCVKGSAFLWGATAKEPALFLGNSKTDGMRAGLAAQWYETSKKAGNTEKTVIIWQEGYTSASGAPIDYFIDPNGSRATYIKTATMVNACYDYYTTGAGAKGYDIVNCGLYWFQGESNLSMSFITYKEKFMEYFNGLNSLTSNRVKYCGFMRIRNGVGPLALDVASNGAHMAQKELVKNNDNMYMASVITGQWKGDGKNTVNVDISKYDIFGEEQYKSIVSGTTLTEKQENIYGGLHYGPLGFNILGADAAVNMYAALHK